MRPQPPPFPVPSLSSQPRSAIFSPSPQSPLSTEFNFSSSDSTSSPESHKVPHHGPSTDLSSVRPRPPRVRRKYNPKERLEVHLVRKFGACELCRIKKVKCYHTRANLKSKADPDDSSIHLEMSENTMSTPYPYPELMTSTDSGYLSNDEGKTAVEQYTGDLTDRGNPVLWYIRTLSPEIMEGEELTLDNTSPRYDGVSGFCYTVGEGESFPPQGEHFHQEKAASTPSDEDYAPGVTSSFLMPSEKELVQPESDHCSKFWSSGQNGHFVPSTKNLNSYIPATVEPLEVQIRRQRYPGEMSFQATTGLESTRPDPHRLRPVVDDPTSPTGPSNPVQTPRVEADHSVSPSRPSNVARRSRPQNPTASRTPSSRVRRQHPYDTTPSRARTNQDQRPSRRDSTQQMTRQRPQILPPRQFIVDPFASSRHDNDARDQNAPNSQMSPRNEPWAQLVQPQTQNWDPGFIAQGQLPPDDMMPQLFPTQNEYGQPPRPSSSYPFSGTANPSFPPGMTAPHVNLQHQPINFEQVGYGHTMRSFPMNNGTAGQPVMNNQPNLPRQMGYEHTVGSLSIENGNAGVAYTPSDIEQQDLSRLIVDVGQASGYISPPYNNVQTIQSYPPPLPNINLQPTQHFTPPHHSNLSPTQAYAQPYHNNFPNLQPQQATWSNPPDYYPQPASMLSSPPSLITNTGSSSQPLALSPNYSPQQDASSVIPPPNPVAFEGLRAPAEALAYGHQSQVDYVKAGGKQITSFEELLNLPLDDVDTEMARLWY